MVKPFDDISLKNKEKLINNLRGYTVTYKKNNVIVDEFNDADDLGYIVSGKIDIIRNNYNGTTTLIEELEADNLISYALVYLNSSECEIVVKEDVEIIIFSYSTIINSNMNDKVYFQFIKNLFIAFNNELEKRNERIEILTKRSIRDKLLEYFNITSKKTGSKYIYLPFNFSSLANYLAIDRSAMSRELGYMKEEGFIAVKGKRITLLYK